MKRSDLARVSSDVGLAQLFCFKKFSNMSLDGPLSSVDICRRRKVEIFSGRIQDRGVIIHCPSHVSSEESVLQSNPT